MTTKVLNFLLMLMLFGCNEKKSVSTEKIREDETMTQPNEDDFIDSPFIDGPIEETVENYIEELLSTFTIDSILIIEKDAYEKGGWLTKSFLLRGEEKNQFLDDVSLATHYDRAVEDTEKELIYYVYPFEGNNSKEKSPLAIRVADIVYFDYNGVKYKVNTNFFKKNKIETIQP